MRYLLWVSAPMTAVCSKSLVNLYCQNIFCPFFEKLKLLMHTFSGYTVIVVFSYHIRFSTLLLYRDTTIFFVLCPRNSRWYIRINMSKSQIAPITHTHMNIHSLTSVKGVHNCKIKFYGFDIFIGVTFNTLFSHIN